MMCELKPREEQQGTEGSIVSLYLQADKLESLLPHNSLLAARFSNLLASLSTTF